jgi:prolyl oligopeptidase
MVACWWAQYLINAPELFKAAIPVVGVMDMLRFQKFTIGWAWTGEYGSSDNFEEFKYLRQYSPYHNISPNKPYPAMLIRTAERDDRVVPAHSYKYAAALQNAYKGSNPILIRIEQQAGHGSGKSVSQTIYTYSEWWSFLFKQLEMFPK